MSGFSPPGDCPVCGAFVAAGETSCKECGACPKTGWSEDTAYDGLDLPLDESEGETAPKKKSDAKRLALAAVLLLVVIVLYVLTKP